MLLLGMIFLLFAFTFLGMEIAWAIGVAAMAYILLSQIGGGHETLIDLPQTFLEGTANPTLLAVPLFIWAGELMVMAGLTQRMVRLASALVGHFHGGLANVSVTANFIMSGASGSAMADAAATGAVLVPEMNRRGYPTTYSCAVIASAATVGPIIPPSIPFVLLAGIADLSVGKLFLAGVTPGVLMFVSMFVLTYFISRRRDFPREPKPARGQRRRAVAAGLPASLAPVFVIGSIVSGIATATEAAAIAVLYVIVLGLAYRSLNGKSFVEGAGNAMLISAVVMLTVATSQAFSDFAVKARLGEVLTDMTLAITQNKYAVLMIVNLILLVLGCFMEPLPIMLVLAPILFPLLGKMGVDPIHLGLIMTFNLMIGMITPPIGLNLFVMSTIGKVGVMEIFREAIPYVIVLFGVLMLCTYIPEITLWLPQLVIPK